MLKKAAAEVKTEKPTYVEELALLSSMIARDESPNIIESRWKKLVAQINSVRPIKDVRGLAQGVLNEAYLEMNKDLQFYSAKVKHFNTMKKQ